MGNVVRFANNPIYTRACPNCGYLDPVLPAESPMLTCAMCRWSYHWCKDGKHWGAASPTTCQRCKFSAGGKWMHKLRTMR
jgi:hypothetical protein